MWCTLYSECSKLFLQDAYLEQIFQIHHNQQQDLCTPSFQKRVCYAVSGYKIFLSLNFCALWLMCNFSLWGVVFWCGEIVQTFWRTVPSAGWMRWNEDAAQYIGLVVEVECWTVGLGAVQWEGTMVQRKCYTMRVRVGMWIMGHDTPYFRSKPCGNMGQEDRISANLGA